MPAAATVATGFKASVKALGGHLSETVKSVGSVIGAAGRNVGKAVQVSDKYVGDAVAANKGNFGDAVKGISAKHPVYATLAATGAVAGTVYAGSKILGRHTDRVLREREEANARDR